MASPTGMGKLTSTIGARKKKSSVQRATIGAPVGDTPPPTDDPTSPEGPPAPPTHSPFEDDLGYHPPKSSGQPFVPVDIPNDDEWHFDDQHIVAEHMLNYGKNPLDVVKYWTDNDSARLKSAEPYDPQHGDYSGMGGTNTLLQSDRYQNAIKNPGQISGGSYSPSDAETIQNLPGSYVAGVVNGMTNRDKYVG
jgi:hypothetical protein